MKVAVLADIHANLAALECVLEEVRAEGIERLIVLGDIVGYYHDPRAVIDALAEFECTAIQGNHDRMALDARLDVSVLENYRNRYGSGLDAVFEQFEERHWDWLAGKPPTREIELGEYRILLAHGTPFDADAYIYPDAPPQLLAKLGEELPVDQIWLGHTHWPFIRSGTPTILNPGSVGQPRDVGGLASWTIFHPETGAIAPRRTEFPVEALLAQCAIRDAARTNLAHSLTRRRIRQSA
ncbi:transporter [Erythrobacter sp. KY5]|uniref:metallophosphoesterase family protein n=1 Tax=Erythrobacter sp. KY5 TaxID=2011159 RepID=UPI000DBF1B1A|nr:metallophosphoesterase family protein [Erythrobacter sp. KY5]AWW73150.1 transporter [Erythrobacter sp. KY5]